MRTRAFTPAALLAVVLVTMADAQGPPRRFTTGGRDIVRVDIAGTAVGDFPAGIQMIDGIMAVVDFNGQRLLRASSRSSFLVRLPQVLPQDFTLEFEIVPKAGGNPEDLAVEGTPQIDQSAGSANVMWHRDYLQIVGGGPTYDSKVPPTFAAGLPSSLTHVAITMQGSTMKLFTNGRLMYTQTRQFARSRVLRVFLGGQDDGPNAVYLAGLGVIDGVAAVGPLVAGGGTGTTTSGSGGAGGSSSGGSGTRPAAGLNQVNTSGTGGGKTPSGGTNPTGPNTSSAPASLVAAPSGNGIGLQWAAVSGAASYRVVRKESGTSEMGTVAPYVVQLPSTNAVQVDAIDPHVAPGIGLTYWVEAAFPDGSFGPPSPVAAATPTWFPAGMPGPANLMVTVPGTQSQAALNGAPGSLVTWAWSAAPSQYGYGVGIDILRTNQLPQGFREYVFTPPVSATDMTPRPATYSRAIPQGVDVLFCVYFWRIDDPRIIPAELTPPKPGLSCISSTVP
jgi:hypothetical protein